MSDNVVGLKGQAVVVPDRKPDAEVVKQARWLLNAAEAGEIKGIAYTLHYGDGVTGRGTAGIMSYSMVGRLHQMIGELIKSLTEE